MLYAYKEGSKSAKALKQAIGIKMIKHEGSSFKGNAEKIVINWGASTLTDEVNKCKVLNEADAVKIASNKLSFFEKVKGQVNIPDFTTNKDEAQEWVENGEIVVIRELLNSSAAKGIQLLRNIGDFNAYHHPNAKLYVRYVPKKDEYRVHVVNGEIIDVRRKALKNGADKHYVNWQIRNHEGGFIFQKNNINPPQEVLEQALRAIQVCGLNFGGVDVMWNNFRKMAYVLEVNTAPGLEGSSVDNYAEAFKKIYEKEVKVVDPWQIDMDKLLEDAKKVYSQKKVKVAPQPKYNLDEVVAQNDAELGWMDEPEDF